MELKKFDAHSLEVTRAAWLASAVELDMPKLNYEMVLDWAAKHCNYAAANGDSYAYGIFSDGSNEAVAIVDIVYSQRPGPVRGWLKMLEVKLSPNFAPEETENNFEKFRQVLKIYAQSLAGTILLTEHHPARVAKLYGRSDSLKELLLALHEHLNTAFANQFSSKMEGRWLVVSAL
jgi:hypothetical protein